MATNFAFDFNLGVPVGNPAQVVGTYLDLTALETAYPTAQAGDLAMVGTILYIWNPDALPPAWQPSSDLQGPIGATGATGTAGVDGVDGESAYAAWVTYAEAQEPPLPQPTGTIADMFDWLASQAATDLEGDITASADITVTALAAGSSPTGSVTVTVTND